MSEVVLEVRDVSLGIGDFFRDGISFEVREGECVALMGPSGCGKSMLAEVICGLRRECFLGGQILMAGEEIQDWPPEARRVGLVPQEVSLFPGMLVREQLSFGPKVCGWRKAAVRERVEQLGESLGLTDLLGRLPQGLSGGEAKRVALGRALALRPRLLCLDEALTGLDEQKHGEIMEVMRKVISEEKVTVLNITHARNEVKWLCDRVIEVSP